MGTKKTRFSMQNLITDATGHNVKTASINILAISICYVITEMLQNANYLISLCEYEKEGDSNSDCDIFCLLTIFRKYCKSLCSLMRYITAKNHENMTHSTIVVSNTYYCTLSHCWKTLYICSSNIICSFIYEPKSHISFAYVFIQDIS